MKKLFLLPILLLTFLIVPLSHAANIGDPDTLGKTGAMSLGIEYDTMNQKLKLKGGTVSDGMFSESFGAHNARLKTQSEYVVGTVGMLPHLDAFVGFGVTKAKIGLDADYATGGSDAITISDNSNFAYKLGVKGQVPNAIGNIALNGGLQYSAYTMHGKFDLNGQDLSTLFYDPASYNTRTTIHEWQASLTASKHMGRFNPYAGVIYRKTSVHSTTNVHVAGIEGPYDVSFDAKAKQDHSIDAVIGSGAVLTKHIGASVEYQPMNEELSISASYRF